ncbi:MAG: hypothetical protein AB1635_00280 [Acidobacteriota bacterium]
MMPVAAVLAVGALAGVSLALAAQPAPDTARQFLAASFRLTASEFRALDERRPVARSLDASDGREVATLGVIRLQVPAAFYAEQLRNIVDFKRTDAVLQIGMFGDPARVEDAAGLTLDRGDVDQLRRCRPGDCKVQLSAEAIGRFRTEVPWDGPDAHAAAERLMRELLVDLVGRYRVSGDQALMIYQDSNRPLSLADEFRAMMTSRPALLRELFPLFHDYLLAYPRARPTGATIEDVVYWSKEKMGPGTVVSVTHLSLATLHDAGPAAFAATSKQIYSTHYFDSSLGLTILVPDPARASAAYLVYVNRSRLDLLRGFWGGFKRAVIRSRTRGAIEANLVEARDLAETRFRARSTAPGASGLGPDRHDQH